MYIACISNIGTSFSSVAFFRFSLHMDIGTSDTFLDEWLYSRLNSTSLNSTISSYKSPIKSCKRNTRSIQASFKSCMSFMFLASINGLSGFLSFNYFVFSFLYGGSVPRYSERGKPLKSLKDDFQQFQHLTTFSKLPLLIWVDLICFLCNYISVWLKELDEKQFVIGCIFLWIL